MGWHSVEGAGVVMVALPLRVVSPLFSIGVPFLFAWWPC
nr:MAG TPA: hypothetical protein [Caudoviricetes sp.]